MLSLLLSGGCTASCCTDGGICKPIEPRAGLGVDSGNSSTLDVYTSDELDGLSLFSGLITTLGARIFSILHDILDDEMMAGVFGLFSSIAIELLADTGPFALVGPVPVWAFFGHDCIGHGQLEL